MAVCSASQSVPQIAIRPIATQRWSYSSAFSRNSGLITEHDQESLRRSHIAIAGMGGVGGVHLMTLVRLGVGNFTIADPDTFEVGNFNRQYGARLHTVGRNKAEVMAEEALTVNPELRIRVLPKAIDESNVEEFFSGVDVFLDGVDFFSIDARRMLFREAAKRGLWAITAGPVGFSTAWLCFDPYGMRFDDYFDIRDEMDHIDQLISFSVGLAPRATQRSYLDLSRVNVEQRTAPSSGLACNLASAVAASEIFKILCHRGEVRAAPRYSQFDSYTNRLRMGSYVWANRHPVQRIKRWWLKRQLSYIRSAR